ncbi:MAG: M23 family metallopeptidase [Alphaproteobacteria bacterium]
MTAGAVTAGAAMADEPRFIVPVDCDMGLVCAIQQHVDRDPGQGIADFAGGRLTYDGHDGTDFRVRDRVDMARGVPVVAAAAGTVLRVRDGEADIEGRARDAAIAADRMAGNGVVLDHGDGWETQYSHLRQDSIAVIPGQRVAAGDVLGLVGQSGFADFPHVHFAVRHNGQAIDPFGQDQQSDLWDDSADAVLGYRGGGILNLGFTPNPPRMEGVERGVYSTTELPSTIDAIIVWTALFGVRVGDRIDLVLSDPDGGVVVSQAITVERDRASQLYFAGRRKPDGDWQPGLYLLTVRFDRPAGVMPARQEERSARLVVTP